MARKISEEVAEWQMGKLLKLSESVRKLEQQAADLKEQRKAVTDTIRVLNAEMRQVIEDGPGLFEELNAPKTTPRSAREVAADAEKATRPRLKSTANHSGSTRELVDEDTGEVVEA